MLAVEFGERLTTDEQLVERALAGDSDAFGEVVRRWERKIYALAYGITGSVEDARDAAQETFISAYRNLQGFRGEAKVSSWLHRIAVNHCITRKRRVRVRAETGITDLAQIKAKKMPVSIYSSGAGASSQAASVSSPLRVRTVHNSSNSEPLPKRSRSRALGWCSSRKRVP